MPPGSAVGAAYIVPVKGGGKAFVIPPSTEQWTNFADRFGSGSQGSKLATWMKEVPKDGFGSSLARRAGALGFAYDALRYFGNSFAQELRLNEALSMIPYGQPRLWGYTRTCFAGWNCSAAQYTERGFWADGVGCMSLCTYGPLKANGAVFANPPNAATIGHGYHAQSLNPGFKYFRQKEVWVRNAGTPAVAPKYTAIRHNPGLLGDPFPDPAFWPQFQPGTSPWPNIDPMMQPIGQPGPMPAPLPYAVSKPWVVPGYEPAYQPLQTPAPSTSPSEVPGVSPGVSVNPLPGGHVAVATAFPPTGRAVPEGPHINRPDPPGERSKKGRGGWAVASAVAYGFATEVNDFIEAAWQAMGAAGGWQTRIPEQKTNPAEMVADIWNAFGDEHFNDGVFWAQLPVEMAKNEMTDRAIGTLGQLGTSASGVNPLGRPVGYGFGGALGNGPDPHAGQAPAYMYPWNQ